MFKIAAAVLAAALALPVSPARAAAPNGDCHFAVAQVRGSGQIHRGVIFGYAVDDALAPVSVYCYLTVNGGFVVATPAGAGTGFAVTAAPAEALIRDTDAVALCTVINGGTSCVPSPKTLVPSQEVVDLLCTVTRTIGGMGFDILGLVRIEPDGYVYVANARLWYCRESATVYGL